MTDIVPTSSNVFIEQQLDERLRAIEQSFDSDALTIIGDLIDGVDDLIREMVEKRREQDGSGPRLAVILSTDGGFIEIVDKIVDTIRHHYSHVSFIVPSNAFSAGTVLCMAGDEIYMDYYSRLGPIDPQVSSPTTGRTVPALGYLIQWERLIEKARNGVLLPVEAQLMVAAFDQAELYSFEQARKLSVELLEKWLVQYKFKDWSETETSKQPVTIKMKRRRAVEIGGMLNNTDRWHSHGYGISMEVLRRDLNLRIDDLDDNKERSGIVKQYYGLLYDYMLRRRHGGVLHRVGEYLHFMQA